MEEHKWRWRSINGGGCAETDVLVQKWRWKCSTWVETDIWLNCPPVPVVPTPDPVVQSHVVQGFALERLVVRRPVTETRRQCSGKNLSDVLCDCSGETSVMCSVTRLYLFLSILSKEEL